MQKDTLWGRGGSFKYKNISYLKAGQAVGFK